MYNSLNFRFLMFKNTSLIIEAKTPSQWKPKVTFLISHISFNNNNNNNNNNDNNNKCPSVFAILQIYTLNISYLYVIYYYYFYYYYYYYYYYSKSALPRAKHRAIRLVPFRFEFFELAKVKILLTNDYIVSYYIKLLYHLINSYLVMRWPQILRAE